MADKYGAAPPAYPASAYTQQQYDASAYPNQDQGPNYATHPYYQQHQAQPASADYYGQGAPPPQGYYGQQPPQQMHYQQQPAPMAQGHFADGRTKSGAGTGFCAALVGALACCCCLDFIF